LQQKAYLSLTTPGFIICMLQPGTTSCKGEGKGKHGFVHRVSKKNIHSYYKSIS